MVSSGVVVPENDIVPLVPNMKGKVVEVMVKNDAAVKKGQPLLKMDDRHARNLLAQAKAGVTAAEQTLESAKRAMYQYSADRKAQATMIDMRKRNSKHCRKR